MIKSIKVEGKEYDVDDFEGRELVDAERAFGISLMIELDRFSMQGVYALLYLINKRGNPEYTADDALSLNLGKVQKMLGIEDEDEDEEAADPPPNRAARRGAAKKSASTAATSGPQSS